jgi:two-component system response regulator BaeR
VTAAHVLVVEDEARLARLLADYLEREGYRCTVLDDGNAVVPWVRAHAPDLVLLDIMLPGRDGLSVCRELRRFTGVPVVMVTARVEEIDRLLGLELGADDYVCKPFSPREVVARVKAVLRRAAPAAVGQVRDSSPIELDGDALRVRAGGREVELTSVEFHLLETLVRQPGRIFSRGLLMERIYEDGRVVSDRTIDSHVKKLRRKLAEVLPGEELVHSVYGVGYRFEPRR